MDQGKEDKSVLGLAARISDGNIPLGWITTKRVTGSKYQFSVLARILAQRLKRKATFIQYEANPKFLEGVRAQIEEHELVVFGPKKDKFFVLEGFKHEWVKSLRPPKGALVLAETEEGEFEAEFFTRHSLKRRNLLKVLTTLIGVWDCRAPTPETEQFDTGRITDKQRIKWEIRKVQLSRLKKLDWSGIYSFEEFEPLLLKARYMNWREVELGKELERFRRESLLSCVRLSLFRPVFDLMRRKGYSAVYGLLLQNIVDLGYYKALRIMGMDEDRTSKEMELTRWKRQELEDLAKMFTLDEVLDLCQLVKDSARVVRKHEDVGLTLLLLNNSLRLKR